MNNKEPDIMTYTQLLKHIENQENHLLLGNGFNLSLGIDTRYKAIFCKMMDSDLGLYKEVKQLVDDIGYDLESFIGILESDITENNDFLRKFVNNKIKLDFMKATHEIVKSEIKNVYAEKNGGIYILLKNFDNFFTLNYDSFLYLLLLKYKKPDQELDTLAIQTTFKFMEDDMNQQHENIYNIIKQARNKGELEIRFKDDDVKIVTYVPWG